MLFKLCILCIFGVSCLKVKVKVHTYEHIFHSQFYKQNYEVVCEMQPNTQNMGNKQNNQLK